eukprot:sb/3472526/
MGFPNLLLPFYKAYGIIHIWSRLHSLSHSLSISLSLSLSLSLSPGGESKGKLEIYNSQDIGTKKIRGIILRLVQLNLVPINLITALASAKVAIPPPKALPETQLYVLWVFRLKTRNSEGYSVTPFHPIDLKFGMYTRLEVFNLSSKYQVSISSGSEVTEGSHLP